MTDSITRLERALASVHAAWTAEKAMLSECIRCGYMEDNEVLRSAVERRAGFYATAVADLQRRIEQVRTERRDRRSEVDKVALPLLESVFPEKGS